MPILARLRRFRSVMLRALPAHLSRSLLTVLFTFSPTSFDPNSPFRDINQNFYPHHRFSKISPTSFHSVLKVSPPYCLTPKISSVFRSEVKFRRYRQKTKISTPHHRFSKILPTSFDSILKVCPPYCDTPKISSVLWSKLSFSRYKRNFSSHHRFSKIVRPLAAVRSCRF